MNTQTHTYSQKYDPKGDNTTDKAGVSHSGKNSCKTGHSCGTDAVTRESQDNNNKSAWVSLCCSRVNIFQIFFFKQIFFFFFFFLEK